ncbi:capsule assembly Wzi family protein [Peristeroidobacter soli]|uniref:capsule assembly Wzi family protein n=1 Tax=Peristeroidobacter soli TaxID=2497877 RepID=UPI00101B99C6|nr:capsule assembly Wzi family protein [Peristeroidobacter soli]
MNRISLSAFAVGLALLAPLAGARGVSPYLPLNMSPEMERQIERVMILADRPVMSRPIAAATVLDALPQACRIDAALCKRVRAYLNSYMRKIGVDHASIEGAVTDGSNTPVPNRYGMANDSEFQVSASGHWQVTDNFIVSLGGVADADDATPTGTMVSFGNEYFQLDAGYRPRWYSPFTDSAMLISTEAQTLPSITLSNYKPMGSWGFTYELFMAEMEYSDRIAFGNNCVTTEPPRAGETCTAGKPRLGGMRIAIAPVPGWSLSANRLLQFGGGDRQSSFTDFLRALWRPRQYDNTGGPESQFGNQVASFTSRFIFPGETPFSAYLEYAGEDTSYEGNYRLGNSALSIGLHFPRLWKHFDLTVEASEWQNAWYVNGAYGDGLTENGRVLGHWGADQRVFGDAVGAQSFMARLGWEPGFGGLMQFRGRTIANEGYVYGPYGLFPYERGYDVSLSYSRTLRGFTAGGELTAGKDTFGDSYSRIAGFVRFGDQWDSGGPTGDWSSDVRRPNGADLFVDAGISMSDVTYRPGTGDLGPPPVSDPQQTSSEWTPHIGIGARRSVSSRSDLGVRLEFDRIDDHMLLAVRALDYRYRTQGPLAFSAFLGAARYDVATPAYGYYFGAGVQWRNILPKLDLGLDYRYADKVSRDKLLPGDFGADPARELRPDVFYDITSYTLSASYRF